MWISPPHLRIVAKYYVLKVKGKAKIPDYIQVRDADFTLVGYFRPGRAVKQHGRSQDPQQQLFLTLERLSGELPYGAITPIEIDLDAPASPNTHEHA